MSSTRYSRNLGASFVLLACIAGCMEEPAQVLQVGEKAPPFTLELLNGEKSHLDLYSGKGLAITFMASWCPCSNDSIPLMKKAYRDNKDNDLAVLMVGIQDARSKFGRFVEGWDIPFPAGYDKGDLIARAYGVHSPPTTVFIDKNGDVSRVFYGNIDEKPEEFRQWIEEIL